MPSMVFVFLIALAQLFSAPERAIVSAEEDRWRRSNPEAQARAADTVAKLEASIADLETQRAAAAADGRDRVRQDAEEAIEARRTWLVEARRALDDFTPDP